MVRLIFTEIQYGILTNNTERVPHTPSRILNTMNCFWNHILFY